VNNGLDGGIHILGGLYPGIEELNVPGPVKGVKQFSRFHHDIAIGFVADLHKLRQNVYGF